MKTQRLKMLATTVVLFAAVGYAASSVFVAAQRAQAEESKTNIPNIHGEALYNPITNGTESQRDSLSAKTEWLNIKAGVFTMGAVPGNDVLKPGNHPYDGPHWDESPVHEVQLSYSYEISAKQVTLGEFLRFKPGHAAFLKSRNLTNDATLPVCMVTWDEAMAYCRWLSQQEGTLCRLPTEAEWEYAAQNAKTLGLKGLDEEMQEWCSDWWAPYSQATEKDPLGPATGEVRIIRGGKPRVTNRSGSVPGDRRNNLGFRVVRGPLPNGTVRPTLPADEVFQNVQQSRMEWKLPVNPETPVFFGGVPFIIKPDNPIVLPYFGRHHVPSITWCDNGDLLATAFTAPHDAHDQVAILISRLRKGKDKWDSPARFFIAPDRNLCSSIFNAGNGELHSYISIRGSKYVDFSMIKRTSIDNGMTWSDPRIVHEYPAISASMETYQGEPRLWPHMDILRMDDGSLIMPSDVGGGHNCGTVLFVSPDNGDSWSELTRFGWNPQGFAKAGEQAGWIAGIHAPFIIRADGAFLAFGRTNDIDGHSPMSLSTDGGQTWTYQASPFPSVSSGQRSAMLHLREGAILFVSFTDASPLYREKTTQGTDFTDAAGAAKKGFGTFAALSFDDGKTWPIRKLIPADAATPWESGRGGYLSCVQSPDNMIHLVSSSNYYRFNFAWLKTPMPSK